MSFEDQKGEIISAIALALYECEDSTKQSGEVSTAIALALYDFGCSDETKVAQAGEIYAAIAMALYEFEGNECKNAEHDKESFVLTIKRTQNFYSPWNLKANAMRELPLIRRK